MARIETVKAEYLDGSRAKGWFRYAGKVRLASGAAVWWWTVIGARGNRDVAFASTTKAIEQVRAKVEEIVTSPAWADPNTVSDDLLAPVNALVESLNAAGRA